MRLGRRGILGRSYAGAPPFSLRYCGSAVVRWRPECGVCRFANLHTLLSDMNATVLLSVWDEVRICTPTEKTNKQTTERTQPRLQSRGERVRGSEQQAGKTVLRPLAYTQASEEGCDVTEPIDRFDGPRTGATKATEQYRGCTIDRLTSESDGSVTSNARPHDDPCRMPQDVREYTRSAVCIWHTKGAVRGTSMRYGCELRDPAAADGRDPRERPVAAAGEDLVLVRERLGDISLARAR